MKQQINIRLGLISLIAILTTVIGITIVYYNLFQNQVKEDLRHSAWLLVETKVFQRAYQQGTVVTGNLEDLSSDHLRITWIDKDGNVLFDNDTALAGLSNHMDRPEIQEAIRHGEGESRRYSDTKHMNTYYYALRLDNDTILRVSTQAITIMHVFLFALPVITVIAVIILLGCVLIGHMLTRQLMKPIESMADQLDEEILPAYKELEPFARKIRSQHANVLAAAKSRQDFTANVSHELKTPITAISGYAELIENQLISKDSELHIARQIRHNADRLQSLVTDIIQLSELDYKEMPRTFEQIDLLALAEQCVKNHLPVAQEKMIRLSCRGIPAGINADRALIREMIDNLLQNGIRYNKEKGFVDVLVTIEDGHPILTVRDSGIGIPADQLDRVFERFYRVDKSRSRDTGGTGLGLAIVKHIAEIHAAEITIRSELGMGTEVKVRF